VLNTELTAELIAEGLARDVVRAIQDKRKEKRLAFTDRIDVFFATANKELSEAVRQHLDYIKGETLAEDWNETTIERAMPLDDSIAGHHVFLEIVRRK
jgi:isoleucyl-tRNA synthetase